ncbi:MAG TPA: ROK family protein [Baekduia sp.]|uniref:ROK family protein n=1 Tax=Baekduia sp. TaxID=2600305 RepID=UPI002D784CD4|nr:ROK family protein [Baekduia sp.]HET6505258.1 ROK family protein [Baekduia sp.]
MSAGCVIGVDLGGTKLLAGVVEPDLEVRHRVFRLAREGRGSEELLEQLVAAVQEVRVAAGRELLAVGFGIPSLVDVRTGVAATTVHLPLRDVPFRDVMAERLGVPVVVDNDANAAMTAEHWVGAAKGTTTAALLTLGTGIGGGIVVDGQVVRGACGGAGEWGHMVIESDGPLCTCGNRGCLEQLVSGSALGRAARKAADELPDSGFGRARRAGREITGALATELAHDGDPVARDVVASMGHYLGIGLANVVNVINPEVIVVGGGVIAAGELLLAPARRVVAERALAPSRDQVRIVPTRFGDASGMVGAALLAMDAVGMGPA